MSSPSSAGNGGESASGVGVVVVFCGEWRRVSFQGGEGGRGASQLWSWVLLSSVFFGGRGGPVSFRAVKGG